MSELANSEKALGVTVAGLLISVLMASCTMCVTAGPVVTYGDSRGSWEDTFTDTTGIETWDNLELAGDGIEIKGIFMDNFTGTDGEYPDRSKWLITDDGQVLEISNNALWTYIDTVGLPVWGVELVQTNKEFLLNHTLTWRQYIRTVGSGAYYHFFVRDASDDSRLLSLQRNYANQYWIYNFVAPPGLSIPPPAQGWHDFKLEFNSGYIDIYLDGTWRYAYDFGVSSVKYEFGVYEQNAIAHINTDDVLITSNITTANLTSTEIVLPSGQTWESVVVSKSEQVTENRINVSVLDGASLLPISGFENLNETEIDISGIDELAHPTIRLKGHFWGNGKSTPTLSSWKVTWVDTVPPSAPTGLTVNNPWTGYSLLLSWNPNTESDLRAYVLYCSTDNTTFNWIGNVTSGTLSLTHMGLTPGTKYYYKMTAADEMPNQSPFSEVVEGIPDTDMDNDGIGDSIDPDRDGDTVPNPIDDFPDNDNEWRDTDGDGIGDNADADDDNDGVPDANDHFPMDPTEWEDSDGDGIGDNKDPDADNDGYSDVLEEQAGSDPKDPSSVPPDTDGDGIIDIYDQDDDGDGVYDGQDDFPLDYNETTDTDGDGIGDNADADDDNDGVDDTNDAFPKDPSEWNDADGDGVGDNTDRDIDGDGELNDNDDFQYDPNEWVDTDGDGTGDNADTDDDNDGVSDGQDTFPKDSTETVDTDGDGLGDNADTDDDNDGYSDTLEEQAGSDSKDSFSVPLDTDGDGIIDIHDSDDDNDGVFDDKDDFPVDPTESVDTDKDGTGDNADTDDDNDGVDDATDEFPKNPSEWTDMDGDGVGDNNDIDVDGDGVPNHNDAFPFDLTEWSDMDGDGIGDNADDDRDGDGFLNEVDAFPDDSGEWEDFDGDYIGDNIDADDDNDGHIDGNDDYPYDASRWRRPNEWIIYVLVGLILLIVIIVLNAMMVYMTAKTRKMEVEEPPEVPPPPIE